MALTSRLAVIAGGIGGIGCATGKALRSQGAALALLYAPFEAQKVKATISEVYGGAKSINSYECDITSPNSVSSAFAAIAKHNVAFPSILVNAAGYVSLNALEESPPDEILSHYMINLFGPTLTGQAFARMFMRAKQEAKADSVPGGRIVNIASQAAHVALHHHGAYCASKAGLVGLTKCMASEWGPKGITANSVSPGPVWTELGKKAWADRKAREAYQAAVPTGNFAEPGEVARIVLFLCQDQALNINGTDITLDGGYTVR
ncbi:hypothetical protein LTR85_011281 [Meristemomyces frigidus]|nr:hypothetical protein LTR85_011281 [Meristemomyces frigidus]